MSVQGFFNVKIKNFMVYQHFNLKLLKISENNMVRKTEFDFALVLNNWDVYKLSFF